jgi:phosphoglycolate phosphatase
VRRQATDLRLLIFDLDGTLVDSQDQIARSFNVALRAVGAQTVAHEIVYAMIGLPLSHMFTQALPESHRHLVEMAITVYREDFERVEIPRSAPFPGVVETLAAARDAGRTLTIATTKIQEVADAVVDAAGLRMYFNLVLGGDRVRYPKPHPALVLRILEELEVCAEQALVVGDSSYDILMAASAGVPSCGVTYGAQHAETLRAAGATYLINAMPELLPLIGLG